jgi:rare lipoprotein A (peptidoglycan hydrolase)
MTTKCTCGSGGHPRRCLLHPEFFEEHCRELTLEGQESLEVGCADVPRIPARPRSDAERVISLWWWLLVAFSAVWLAATLARAQETMRRVAGKPGAEDTECAVSTAHVARRPRAPMERATATPDDRRRGMSQKPDAPVERVEGPRYLRAWRAPSCGGEKRAKLRGAAPAKASEPHTISRVVVASWYGAAFAGKPMAGGGRFDPQKLTCAHRRLKFGTKLRVCRRGACVVVVVRDRGPFVRGRELDLSEAAARRLGMLHIGVARITMEKV